MSDNAEQWARLRDAIELSEGFALLFVVVANREVEAQAVEALRELGSELERSPIWLDARGTEDEAPVRRLVTDLGERPLAVLRTHGASSRDREAFERCFVQLNARRDQIVAQLAAPLVVIIRVDALRTLGDLAPDLFNVHAAQFHLSSPHDVTQPQDWLLLPHEAFGLLGVGETFGRPSIDGMPSYLEPIPEVPSPLLGRDAEVGRLCAAMARSPRRIRVWGARGVGKSSVIAAAIRELESHYERVLWLHGWAAHTKNAILGAIVRALDERGRCPADPVDIEGRYRELTRMQRVLIVVELVGDMKWGVDSVELPEPASGSLLIEEASAVWPSANVTLEIGPLSADELMTARVAGRPSGDFDLFGRSRLLEAIARTEPPLDPAQLEVERRCLRLHTREWALDADDTELEARQRWIEDWRSAPQTVAQQALESLPMDERATFAMAIADLSDADESFEWTRQAIVSAAVSGQLERARRILSTARESLMLETFAPVWLMDTQLVLALMPPAQLDDTGVAKLLFEWETEFVSAHPEAAALAATRHGLSSSDELEPPGIRAFRDVLDGHPGPDLDAHATAMTRRFADLKKQSAYPDQYDHFAHAHLCVLDLRRAHWVEAKQHLDHVIDSAHTWGLSYPLLRARILTLEYALATGDIEPATIELDATLARCDQLLGPLHQGSLAALTLALRIRDQLGQLDAARILADDCRRRLRYVSPHPAILCHLLSFFEEHGPAEVAASLRTLRTMGRFK